MSICWAAFVAWRFCERVYVPYVRGAEIAAEHDACVKAGRADCGPVTFDDLISPADVANYSVEAVAPIAAGCAYFVVAWVVLGFRAR